LFSPGRPGACGRSPQPAKFRPLQFMYLRANESSGWMRSLLTRRKLITWCSSRRIYMGASGGTPKKLWGWNRVLALSCPHLFGAGQAVRGWSRRTCGLRETPHLRRYKPA
jgi:hypothetical protein